MAYCDRDNVEDRFGNSNVAAWADLDNDEDAAKILARITAAIVAADADIDDLLRGGMYTIPFDEPPPQAIIGISADLAGVWLYENRGIQDYNPETGAVVHRLKYADDRAWKKLRRIVAGQITLDLTLLDEVVPLVEDDS